MPRVAWALVALALAGCGQKGPLYLPDAGGEVITRPTQTPAEAPASDEKPAAPPSTSPR
jgi:predicted small lipoprotein YifL